jgi:hypothetical protein
LNTFVVDFLTKFHSSNCLVQEYINPGCWVTQATKYVWWCLEFCGVSWIFGNFVDASVIAARLKANVDF